MHALLCVQALYAAVQKIVDAAGCAGVQILCLQEAWTMPFAFCTREREWLEFAEPAETGPSTMMLQEYAQKYKMVIINPILERDESHGETIWNTAVVIGHTGNVLGKHRKVWCTHCQCYTLMQLLSLVPTYTTRFGGCSQDRLSQEQALILHPLVMSDRECTEAP